MEEQRSVEVPQVNTQELLSRLRAKLSRAALRAIDEVLAEAVWAFSQGQPYSQGFVDGWDASTARTLDQMRRMTQKEGEDDEQ